MKHTIIILTMLIMAGTMGLSAQNGYGRGRGNGLGDGVDLQQFPREDVSEIEKQHLLTMREEEKLARDVYIYLAGRWDLRVFSQIARSESTHMAAVKSLLDKYAITDPVGEDIPGQFSRGDFQALFAELTLAGDGSIGEALRVGATIEDLDISDLLKAISESDSRDILTVFQNLAKGSRNHLRTFVTQLEALQLSYLPRFISMELFESIIGSDPERGFIDATGQPTGEYSSWD